MVNALSVLGWGVGGIEAEASMLGEPISMKMTNRKYIIKSKNHIKNNLTLDMQLQECG